MGCKVTLGLRRVDFCAWAWWWHKVVWLGYEEGYNGEKTFWAPCYIICCYRKVLILLMEDELSISRFFCYWKFDGS